MYIAGHLGAPEGQYSPLAPGQQFKCEENPAYNKKFIWRSNGKRFSEKICWDLVRKERLELSRLTALEPKSIVQKPPNPLPAAFSVDFQIISRQNPANPPGNPSWQNELKKEFIKKAPTRFECG
ncbi:hypothetical protein [Sideroxyarcus emersonii]|uniref:hypothetical protein n=1 Tax=Sideroxyarcus emersonii TaxID=2764705 RepID=UPI001F452323|nr:hypothetical protein [Sideroxyarcus emersonii]